MSKVVTFFFLLARFMILNLAYQSENSWKVKPVILASSPKMCAKKCKHGELTLLSTFLRPSSHHVPLEHSEVFSFIQQLLHT